MSDLPIHLSARSGVPRYRQVINQIADAIRAGTLAPGARLPSVRELSVQLTLSLITVRRAYAELARAGLVVRRQGQGTFVADSVGDAAHSQGLADAREGLEAAVSRARKLGMTAEEVVAVVEQVAWRTP